MPGYSVGQKIYDKLKITRKAKATDLENYFKIEKKGIRTNKVLVNSIVLQKL